MGSMYNELAYLEHIISKPEESSKDSEFIIAKIKEINPDAKTMLHLGSGAGIDDYHFKKHFQITGIDLSMAMIDEARKINPEAAYILGDMRDFRLDRKFDVVVIPDSIMHITALEDVETIFARVADHLSIGGILAIVYQPNETYRDNNFIYEGTDKDYSVTVFENNHRIDNNHYEAIITYVIRQNQKTDVINDRYVLGLFDTSVWNSIFDSYPYLSKSEFQTLVSNNPRT